MPIFLQSIGPTDIYEFITCIHIFYILKARHTLLWYTNYLYWIQQLWFYNWLISNKLVYDFFTRCHCTYLDHAYFVVIISYNLIMINIQIVYNMKYIYINPYHFSNVLIILRFYLPSDVTNSAIVQRASKTTIFKIINKT